MVNDKASVLFIPHGGGPLPLLDDPDHEEMVLFLKKITTKIIKPSVILVISEHWEEKEVTITSSGKPELIYDYYGFPDQAYNIQYPVSGDVPFASKIFNLLKNNGIQVKLDDKRGIDHGVFVPLKIMYPDADIPCVQMSLINSLDPKAHIAIGHALSELSCENVLILGSGFSFHNLQAFNSRNIRNLDEGNQAFEQWLTETCTNDAFTSQERTQKLIQWSDAPSARYCHPREEHLLPLHVCFGVAGTAAKLVFDGEVIRKKASAFLWK